MKACNLSSLCSSRVARCVILHFVGLFIVVLIGGTIPLLLHAQDGPTSGKTTNLDRVALHPLGAKALVANNDAPQSRVANFPDATIEHVDISGKGEQTQVRVDGTGYLTYKAFWLNQPDRLVLDFSGAVVREQERSISSSFQPVHLVRIGQFKTNVARVVIEIEKQSTYTITASSHSVMVAFGPFGGSESTAAAKREISSNNAVVPPKSVPSAATQSVGSQAAKSAPESSVKSAMDRPTQIETEPSKAVGTDGQTAYAQTQAVAPGSVSQSGGKYSPQSLPVTNSGGQQQDVAATQTVSGYVLGPDDEVVIRGIVTPEISDKPEKPDTPVLIGTNGDITLPLIGRVKAGGLTVEQLETELSTRYKEFIRNPQISVTVTEFRSQPVSVFGAVTKPGVIQLRGPKTLYEVLSMAGGPRDTAGSSLTVTRRRENGEIPLPDAKTDPTGQFSSVDLNVQEILEGKNPAVNIEIKPNDVISVSEATTNMVYVVGDVQRAGAFTMGGQRNLSVLRALSQAGGLGRTALPQKARIIRETSADSKFTEIPVNLHKILSGKAEDVALRPNDVLVVPTSSRKVFTTDFLPSAFADVMGAAIYHY